jgi:ABC-type oligopeptide transport system ATPase subunit
MSSLNISLNTKTQKVALALHEVTKTYRVQKSFYQFIDIHAVQNVSFNVLQGETLSIVGESGSGKSTLAKMIMKLEQPTSGVISIDYNQTMAAIAQVEPREYYQKIQMVFQDPYGSLNPRKRIWEIVSTARNNYQKLSRQQSIDLAEQYLMQVGLASQYLFAFPHMLSGGQRQRVGIARALVNDPEILVLDEPLSALDISIQAQIINLLMALQKELGLTYVFISHNMALVRHISDRVCVMNAGELVEHGDVDSVIHRPKHEYTKKLIASSLDLDLTY